MYERACVRAGSVARRVVSPIRPLTTAGGVRRTRPIPGSLLLLPMSEMCLYFATGFLFYTYNCNALCCLRHAPSTLGQASL
jgi:hypothetical protein